MRSLLILIISAFILASCSLETAAPDNKTDLVIASNFLKTTDTIYYKGFEKRTGINIKILHLSVDSIQKRLKSKGFNSKIDLVFLQSLNNLNSLEAAFFHEFKYDFAKNQIPSFKPILKNRWLVAGIDPYVFSYFQDSTKRPTQYNELTKGYLWATPNEDNLNIFLAHVKYNLRKKDKHGFKEWYQNFKRNQVIYDEGTDSLASIQFLFSKESDILTDSRLSKQKKRILSYPSANANCNYADRYCIGLVEQSQNFYHAKKLLKYIHNYRRIPASFKIRPFPTNEKNKRFMLSERAILSMLKTNNK